MRLHARHFVKVGASGGTVLVWDLRRQNELFTLAGRSLKGGASSIAEGEIWDVKLDPALQESAKIPPTLICSEDAILAIIEAGVPTKLVVEACAINSFDVNLEYGSEIVYALEHESAILALAGTTCSRLSPCHGNSTWNYLVLAHEKATLS